MPWQGQIRLPSVAGEVGGVGLRLSREGSAKPLAVPIMVIIEETVVLQLVLMVKRYADVLFPFLETLPWRIYSPP